MARLVRALLAAVFLVGATVLSTSPAQASHLWPVSGLPVEQTNGTRVSAPDTSGMFCIGDDLNVGDEAIACWQPAGDIWLVKDNRADGRSAAAIWEINSCNSSGVCETLVRQGICRNPHGAGTWARCNKDYAEDRLVWFNAAEAEGFHVLDFGIWALCPSQWPCQLFT